MGGKTKPPYAAEFRDQIVELYASGRTAKELSREFCCAEQSILNWARRAGKLSALPDKGANFIGQHKQARALADASSLNAQERAELERLRRDNRRLQSERDILAKATAWFANETTHGSKGSTR
jgi:transposase